MLCGTPHASVRALIGCAALTTALAAVSSSSAFLQTADLIPYEIVARYPHDPLAYTQGLYYEDGFLFEGTGRLGRSFLRRVGLASGSVRQEVSLLPRFFGEGITSHGDQIYQLTWTSGVGFIYDKRTFARVGQFTYPGEGWGLTGDGRYLVMSDGSATLRFLRPTSLEEVRRIEIRDVSGPVNQLNELEYIDGSIYANVWHTNRILKISPESGKVLGELDLSDLALEVQPSDPEAVLNGIAYDAARDRIFVTGKLWPTIFELRLLP